MINLSKKIKIVLSAFLVLVISISSFAGIISGSDGTNFITKEEFDIMRQEFDSQISSYQASLENKIDGAIAAYLAGLARKNQENAVNLLEHVEDAWDKKIIWTNATEIGVNEVSNYNQFLLTVINSTGTKNTVGLFTAGYAPDDNEEVYLNGYNVLKRNKNGDIICNVKYEPRLYYTIAYALTSVNGEHTEDLEFYKDITNYGESQQYTGTKFWIGYKDNAVDITSTRLGAQSVSVYYISNENYSDFIMAPLAASSCSVWDPDNTEATATGTGRKNTSPAYTTDISGGTNSATIKQTIKNYPLYTSDFDNELPWVNKDQVYNEQVLNFNSSFAKPCKMKYGLPVVQSDKSTELHWTIDAKKGKIGWYINTPMSYEDIPEKQKMNIDADGDVKGYIDVDEGDVVYFIYLPEEQSQLKFKELYYVLF